MNWRYYPYDSYQKNMFAKRATMKQEKKEKEKVKEKEGERSRKWKQYLTAEDSNKQTEVKAGLRELEALGEMN